MCVFVCVFGHANNVCRVDVFQCDTMGPLKKYSLSVCFGYKCVHQTGGR